MPEQKTFVLDLRIRLRSQEDLIFGKGISDLLRRCEKYQSLHMAAKSMHMSYRKALSMVKLAEEGFNQPILNRSIGGTGGGGSHLTPFGRELVENFTAFESYMERQALENWNVFFPDSRLHIDKSQEE